MLGWQALWLAWQSIASAVLVLLPSASLLLGILEWDVKPCPRLNQLLPALWLRDLSPLMVGAGQCPAGPVSMMGLRWTPAEVGRLCCREHTIWWQWSAHTFWTAWPKSDGLLLILCLVLHWFLLTLLLEGPWKPGAGGRCFGGTAVCSNFLLNIRPLWKAWGEGRRGDVWIMMLTIREESCLREGGYWRSRGTNFQKGWSPARCYRVPHVDRKYLIPS